MRNFGVGTLLVLAGFTATAAASPCEILDTFLVPSDGTNVDSNIVLEAGVEYTIWAEDTFTFNQGPDPADAEWWWHAADETWYESGAGCGDLRVDGASPTWMGTPDPSAEICDDNIYLEHVFSPSHVYKITFVGQGDTVDFDISDSVYSDNVGALTVSITPEPASLMLLSLAGLLIRRR